MKRKCRYNYRILLMALVLILAAAVSACGKEKQPDDQSKTEQPTVTSSGQENTASDDIFTEHELNIIDDNYRTYYEIFVYSFFDSDGDRVGDLQGVIQKLDYIQKMGFNGIWLMPIMPSTTYHKYDVTDYYAIDPEYGTTEDFKELVKACEDRGIKLIIDLVLNHTSSKHAWFQTAVEYLQSLPADAEPDETECPYVGYYNFVKGTPSSGVYYPVSGTEYYYEGVFWEHMPDLNLGNEALRKDLEQVMSYWLDLGVGGFRLDAAKEFYTGSITKNVEVLRWVSDYVKSVNKDNYLVAEVWDSYNNFTQYYESGIDSLFNFAFADTEGKIAKVLNYSGSQNSAKSYAEALVKFQERIHSFYPGAIDAPFFVNHDLARAAGYFSYNENKIKMAAAMNLMMTGNAFVYYGEEIGMTGSGKDENKRAPMYWSDKNIDGITRGPADMETQEHKFGALDQQLEDPLSIANFYKHLIRLRNENPEIARGTVALLDGIEDEDIAAVKKTWEGSNIVILMNLSETEEKTVTVDLASCGVSELRNYLSVDGSKAELNGTTVVLPPYSMVLLK